MGLCRTGLQMGHRITFAESDLIRRDFVRVADG
jgi:hypothetical protein